MTVTFHIPPLTPISIEGDCPPDALPWVIQEAVNQTFAQLVDEMERNLVWGASCPC